MAQVFIIVYIIRVGSIKIHPDDIAGQEPVEADIRNLPAIDILFITSKHRNIIFIRYESNLDNSRPSRKTHHIEPTRFPAWKRINTYCFDGCTCT